MNTDHDHEPDNEPNNEPNNEPDNEPDNGRAVVPTPAGDALVSLQALATALNSVDTSSVSGRSGMPMLQFKRDGNGTWWYGRKKTVVEDDSRWAVNPMTFRWGYICFSDGNKVLGERLVSVSQPKPEVMDLPDKGFPWTEQWAVNLKCISGADAGTEVVYKPTTDGGIQAVAGMVEVVRDRLNGGGHDGKVAPIVCLGKDSYPNPQHGRVWTPVLTVVDWMPLSGPAPAPTPASPLPAEQPRRRRVA
jgi:hypothetical protein